MQNYWSLAKKIYSEWDKHEAPRMGAALAFYTILSLSPLLLLVVGLAGIFFGRSGVAQQLTSQAHSLLGQAGDQVLNETLSSTQKSSGGGWAASAVSFLVLLISASGVFGELRSALNKIWEVQAQAAAGIWGMIRERLLSFGMVLSVGFLLIASLVASAVLTAASGYLGSVLPMPAPVAWLIDFAISLFGIAAVFALMFRYVPASRIRWKQAWYGGLFTAVLFTLGKYALSFYLGKAAPGSAYGAAGSIVVVIVWIYYTAQIVFFGAEFTHVLAAGASVTNTQAQQSRPFVIRTDRPQPINRERI